MKKIVRWFEMNFGWFFVNGRKQAAWAEYLRKKYNTEPKINVIKNNAEDKKIVSLSEEKEILILKGEPKKKTTRKPRSKKVKTEN